MFPPLFGKAVNHSILYRGFYRLWGFIQPGAAVMGLIDEKRK